MNTSIIMQSAIAPAAPATLPARIVLHRTGNPHCPYATHMAVLHGDRWVRIHGHYFNLDEAAEALANYLDRCKRLNVSPIAGGEV